MRAEHLLQVGKAFEAQRLGEADQGRGLDVGAAGDGRGRFEREFVRVLECVRGCLAQTLRQLRLDLDEALFQRVEILRRRCSRALAHSAAHPAALRAFASHG